MTVISRTFAGLAGPDNAGAHARHRNIIGQREYENKCAMCHGATGEGDGSFAQHLKRSPPSPTQLQKKNRGVFPFNHVYQFADHGMVRARILALTEYMSFRKRSDGSSLRM